MNNPYLSRMTPEEKKTFLAVLGSENAKLEKQNQALLAVVAELEKDEDNY